MMKETSKLITSKQYHIWTDALHARTLARQSDNEWNRGAYVRWAVNTAWTAFEVVCEYITGDSSGGITLRFPERLNEVLVKMKFTPLDCGKGIWQEVAKLYGERKKYTHKGRTEDILFPALSIAEDAISVIRKAVIDLHLRTHKEPPDWVNDDTDYGLTASLVKFYSPSMHQTHLGAKEYPYKEKIRIVIVSQGKEIETDSFPPGAPYKPRIQQLKTGSTTPMTEIRVYQGDTLIERYKVPIRGV